MELLAVDSSLAMAGLAVRLMELLLIGACLSLLALAVAFIVLAAAARVPSAELPKMRASGQIHDIPVPEELESWSGSQPLTESRQVQLRSPALE